MDFEKYWIDIVDFGKGIDNYVWSDFELICFTAFIHSFCVLQRDVDGGGG